MQPATHNGHIKPRTMAGSGSIFNAEMTCWMLLSIEWLFMLPKTDISRYMRAVQAKIRVTTHVV